MIDFSKFNPRVLAKLKAIGWHENWNAAGETDAWIEKLSKKGFVVNQHAVEVLTAFGGVECDRWDIGEEGSRPFQISPISALVEYEYINQFFSELFPLGEFMNGLSFLAVASNGTWFSVGDRFELVGNDLYDAFERILLVKPLSLIQE